MVGKRHRVWEPGLTGGRAEHVKESKDGTVNVMVPVTSSSLALDRWWSGGVSLEGRIASMSQLTLPDLLLGTKIKSREQLSNLKLVQCALGYS